MIRQALPKALGDTRIVAVIRGQPVSRAVDVALAASSSGIAVIEITMDSPDACASIERLTTIELVVGAGTVLSVEDAVSAVDSGASFLVSPHTDVDVLAWAVGAGVPIVPGGVTPTEVMTAWNLGAAAVKLFPASMGGPALVRAISAPLREVPLMVTGGVDGSNIGDFFAAGASYAGIGGWLVDHGDLDIVAARAAELVAAIEARDPNV